MDVNRKLSIGLYEKDVEFEINDNIANFDKNQDAIADNNDYDIETGEVELDQIDEEKLLNSINRRLYDFIDEEDENYSNENNYPVYNEENKFLHNDYKRENIKDIRTDINEAINIFDKDDIKNSFERIIIKYDINKEFAIRINALKEFKTVFVFDDSTSMNCVLEDSSLNTPEKKVKRWEELQNFANISIDIANTFNEGSKTDVYFLNREPIFDITDSKQFLETLRQIKPRGYTPLTKVYESLVENNKEAIRDNRKLLVIFVTDGEPTDDHGQNDTKSFYRVLQTRNHDRIYITIVACTDDQKSINYLTQWDKKIKNLDIVDDYQTVKNEVIRSKGSKFIFSYGDYVVKAFVGSFDKELDEIDTKKTKLHYALKKLNLFRNKPKNVKILDY